MNTPFQDMHDENMKIIVCEHGNSHHCQSCEVKQLKNVIESLENEKEILKIMVESSMSTTKAWVKHHAEMEGKYNELQHRIDLVINQCGVNWINKTLKGE